ncbi:MAG: YhbY family RNA-binding protein [Gammaproteobacteria bacterium]
MHLSETQKKKLRAIGHTLKPVVTVGSAGLTASVIEEFARSVEHHELLKIKVIADDRIQRDAIIEQLCVSAKAQLIQRVGHIALICKISNKKSRIIEQISSK